jgi:DUF4097 and DUF4098 domain-containing protein YvlB
VRRETFATDGPVRLVVKLPAGQVELETAETAETVVELEPLNERGDDVLREASVDQRGDQIRVDLDQKRFLLLGRTPEIRVRVRAPHGSSANVSAASADVSGRGRFGEVEVKTASGDVGFDDVDGDVHVNVVSGDVRFGAVGGETDVKSVSGDVRVGRLGAGARVNTVSGDMTLEELVEGKVSLKSVSGSVRAGIRRGSSLWVDAKSVSGKTTSELELDDAAPAESGPLVELRANSVSGDIRIVRASSSVPA